MPAHFTASNTGCSRTMIAPSPATAAQPWITLELATPSPLHAPRRRPPINVLRVTTVKSGPGIRTSTIANPRKDPYAAHGMRSTVASDDDDLCCQAILTIWGRAEARGRTGGGPGRDSTGGT